MGYYKLENDQLEVVLTTFGGSLDSIRTPDGRQYLWQGDTKYWSGKAPVLFPICGSLRGDKAIIGDGMETSMPRHGIVRKEEFQFVKQEKDTVTFSIENTQDMLQKFPYEFKLCTSYKLIDKSIQVSFEVENKSEKAMPFFIGGHPGFNCPLLDGESYEDYYLEFEKEENCSIPTPITETGLIDVEHQIPCLTNERTILLMHELFHEDALILDKLKSRKVQLKSRKNDVGIELSFEDFPYLILWSSSNDGPFIALEPWSGLSTCSDEDNVFEHKRNVQVIEPGERKTYSFTITIL